MKKQIAFIFVALLTLLIPQGTVHADMGPKPEMEFTFLNEDGNPDIFNIASGTLYECSLADYSDAMPLEEMGPQRFECDATSCYAMAYGFSDFFQLEVTFTDGTTRKSSIFEKKQFSANYLVTLQGENSLSVKEERPSIPFLPLVLTLVIELLLAYLYATYRNKELPLKRFLLVILIINLITQPIFTYYSVVWENMGMGIFCLFAEMIIFFVEAFFIYFFMKKEISFGKALILSFIFNFVSFFIGLFLPV